MSRISGDGGPTTPGLLTRLPELPRKVALLRASRVGDFLCATPAIRALRAALPDAELTIITLPLLRDLALRSPHLDRFVAFPGFPGIAEQLFEPRCAIEFFADMQAERFDLAVQMQGSGVYSNPFTLLLGARVTAGFIRPGDAPGRLDAALPMPACGSEIERVLALARFLGAEPRGARMEFPMLPKDHAQAAELLRGSARPLIGIHAGARDATRRWPCARFAEVGLALHARIGGTLVLVGDANAGPASACICERAMRNDIPCLDLSGRTTLPVLGAVIARLAVLITNDSGPAHVAYALGAPSVTIYGGVDPATYPSPEGGPHRVAIYETPCRPDSGAVTCAGCPHDYTCLRGVTVAQALALADDAIRARGPASRDTSRDVEIALR